MDTDEYTLTISPLNTASTDAAREKAIDRIREYKSIQNSIRNNNIFMTEMSTSISIENETQSVETPSSSTESMDIDIINTPTNNDIIPIVTEEEAIEMRNIIIGLSQKFENMEKVQTKNEENATKLQKIVDKQAKIIKNKNCELQKYKQENELLSKNEKDFKIQLSIQQEIRKKCAMYASVIRNHEMEIKKLKKENKMLRHQHKEHNEAKRNENETDKEIKLKTWKQNKRNQEKNKKLESMIADMNMEMETLKNKLIKAENGYNAMMQTNKREIRKKQKLEREINGLQNKYMADCGYNDQMKNELMVLTNNNKKLKQRLKHVRCTLSESVTNEYNISEQLQTQFAEIQNLEDEIEQMKVSRHMHLEIIENAHWVHIASEKRIDAISTAKTEQMSATIANLTRKCERLQNEKMQEVLLKQKKMSEHHRSELKRIKKENKALVKNESKLKMEIAELTKNYDGIEKKSKSECFEKLSIYRNKIKKLQSNIQSMNDEMGILSEKLIKCKNVSDREQRIKINLQRELKCAEQKYMFGIQEQKEKVLELREKNNKLNRYLKKMKDERDVGMQSLRDKLLATIQENNWSKRRDKGILMKSQSYETKEQSRDEAFSNSFCTESDDCF